MCDVIERCCCRCGKLSSNLFLERLARRSSRAGGRLIARIVDTSEAVTIALASSGEARTRVVGSCCNAHRSHATTFD